MSNNNKPTGKQIKSISEEIIRCFPGENLNTYYVYRDGGVPPYGKLYNKFGYQSKKISKFVRKHNAAANNLSVINQQSETDTQTKVTELPLQLSDDYLKIKTELKHLRSPRESLLQKWQSSSKERMEEIQHNKDSSLVVIFEDWPLYKHPFGPELINIDFNTMYPKCQTIYSKWSSFIQKLPGIVASNLKHAGYKKAFQNIHEKKNDLNSDTYHIEIFNCLSALLPPSMVNINSKTKNFVKYSIKDSQNWFLMEVGTLANMEIELDNIRKKCLLNKTHLQPLLICLGKPNDAIQFIIIIDGFKYVCGSFLEAVDVHFKLFQIFQLEYPKQCINVWLFIQLYFYGIKTKYDKYVPSVLTLITDLENRPE